jgi:hypothetical protein
MESIEGQNAMRRNTLLSNHGKEWTKTEAAFSGFEATHERGGCSQSFSPHAENFLRGDSVNRTEGTTEISDIFAVST